MLNNHQGSTSSDKEKGKVEIENLHTINKRMTNTFEEDSYEEESINVESLVKNDPKILGRNKLPAVDGIPIEFFQATVTQSVKILIRICQQI